MVRTQIQLTEQQARALKQLAAREGKSMAELIRNSVDNLLRASVLPEAGDAHKKAIAAAGRFHDGPRDLSLEHDRYLQESFES